MFYALVLTWRPLSTVGVYELAAGAAGADAGAHGGRAPREGRRARRLGGAAGGILRLRRVAQRYTATVCSTEHRTLCCV